MLVIGVAGDPPRLCVEGTVYRQNTAQCALGVLTLGIAGSGTPQGRAAAVLLQVLQKELISGLLVAHLITRGVLHRGQASVAVIGGGKYAVDTVDANGGAHRPAQRVKGMAAFIPGAGAHLGELTLAVACRIESKGAGRAWGDQLHQAAQLVVAQSGALAPGVRLLLELIQHCVLVGPGAQAGVRALGHPSAQVNGVVGDVAGRVSDCYQFPHRVVLILRDHQGAGLGDAVHLALGIAQHGGGLTQPVGLPL